MQNKSIIYACPPYRLAKVCPIECVNLKPTSLNLSALLIRRGFVVALAGLILRRVLELFGHVVKTIAHDPSYMRGEMRAAFEQLKK